MPSWPRKILVDVVRGALRVGGQTDDARGCRVVNKRLIARASAASSQHSPSPIRRRSSLQCHKARCPGSFTLMPPAKTPRVRR
jgi:hypothetical protein